MNLLTCFFGILVGAMGVVSDRVGFGCIYETLPTRLAKYHRMNDITLLLYLCISEFYHW